MNNNLVHNAVWAWEKFSYLLSRPFSKKEKHVSRAPQDEPDLDSPKQSKKGFAGFSFTRLSTKEQTFFAKRLSFLNKAGVPMLDGLHMLKEQTKSRGLGRVLDQVIIDFSNGQYLSTSLGKFERIFGNFAINIIKVGEASGTLSQNLDYLADELQKKQILRRKILGAFVYPGVITIATLGITGFLMIYLFPKIMPVFKSLHMTLPLSTRIVIAGSDLLTHYGLLLLGITLVLAVTVVVLHKKSTRIHMLFDMAAIRLPVIGNTMQYYNLANTCRTLGLLLQSGIPITEALPITADTTANLLYKRELHIMSKVVARGEKMSTRFIKNRTLFPEIVPHMVAVGERSGNLSNSLIYLSELYENDVNEFTKNLSTLIEPILMIFMGVLVGFIAISIITPIYGITQNLHN